MNVVIVGGFWFPSGTASAARVRNLALGLRESGARVHVITMAPHPRQGDVVGDQGRYEGISYECASPIVASVVGYRDAERTVPQLGNRLTDKLRWFGGLYGAGPRARARVRRRIERRECDLVVAYDRSAVRMNPMARLCRAEGVPSILDVVEVSEHLSGSRLSPIYWDSRAGTSGTARRFDGLTVITRGLEERYQADGCTKTLIVPAIEDWPPGEAPEPTSNPAFRLTYVGALLPRDAPELLFDAVRIVASRGLPLVLDVVGHYKGTARAARFERRCAQDPLLGPRVRFVGTLGDQELKDRLRTSDGLVLPRRPAVTEELSFPTRLVEYLRYGRPVFVSDVGDVSRYLTDGQEAALLHPTDPERAADKIAGVAARADRGAEMGRLGRKAGARSFDRKVHARQLLQFAEGLRPRRAS